MLGISNITSQIKNLLNGETTPFMSIPTFLLLATSIQRPGMSAMDITSSIIEDNGSIGINTGDNPDGSPNLVNAYTYNVVRNIIHSLKMDSSVQCVIPAGSLTITGNGGNAGGPVTITGSNVLPLTIKGIIG